MPTQAEILAVKQRATPGLLAIPGVVAVGIGSKEVQGQPTGQPTIKVYVREKRPAAELPPDQLIPAQIEGVPTDVVIGGEPIPVQAPPGAVIEPNQGDDSTRYRPLLGGARIAPVGSSFQGTLGCLLRHTTDPEKVYALTAEHVVRVKDVRPITVGTTQLGQPSGVNSSTDCCDDMIGTYAGGGKSADRDEALVELLPGTTWLAEIKDIGVVSGRHDVSQAEANTGTYRVRKRGRRTKLTGGVISSLRATTQTADNLIIVTPNPNPAAGPGDTVYFAYEGDSGSALVNEDNEVVGLVWARSAAGLGYAYAIDNVLARFASVESLPVEVASAANPGEVQTVPGAAMVTVPPEVVAGLLPQAAGRPARAPVAGWLAGDQPDLSAGMARAREDLDRSRTGRQLIGLWLEHQRELLDLVNHNRRVTLTWHRGGGAAVLQLLIRMLGEPDLALPRSVHGQPLSQVVDRMREVFARFGSPALRRDLGQLQAALPDLAGLSYPQIIAALDRA